MIDLFKLAMFFGGCYLAYRVLMILITFVVVIGDCIWSAIRWSK